MFKQIAQGCIAGNKHRKKKTIMTWKKMCLSLQLKLQNSMQYFFLEKLKCWLGNVEVYYFSVSVFIWYQNSRSCLLKTYNRDIWYKVPLYIMPLRKIYWNIAGLWLTFYTGTPWTNPTLIYLFISVIARNQIISIIKQLSNSSHMILRIFLSDSIFYHFEPFCWDFVTIYSGDQFF